MELFSITMDQRTSYVLHLFQFLKKIFRTFGEKCCFSVIASKQGYQYIWNYLTLHQMAQSAAEFLCFLLKDIYVHSYFLLFSGVTVSVLTSPNCLTLSPHPTSVMIQVPYNWSFKPGSFWKGKRNSVNSYTRTITVNHRAKQRLLWLTQNPVETNLIQQQRGLMAHVPGILSGLSWPLMWLDRRSGFINLAPCVRFILGLTCIMVQNNCSILRFCILSFALWFAIRIEHLC